MKGKMQFKLEIKEYTIDHYSIYGYLMYCILNVLAFYGHLYTY